MLRLRPVVADLVAPQTNLTDIYPKLGHRFSLRENCPLVNLDRLALILVFGLWTLGWFLDAPLLIVHRSGL